METVKRKKMNSNSGMALLMTLLVTAILTTVVVEYNYDANVNLDIAENYTNRLKANYLANAGVAFAKKYLESNIDDFLGGFEGIELLLHGKPIPMGEGFVTINLDSEEGRINLNKLLTSKRTQKQFLNLLENLDIDKVVYYSLMDWLDKDDDERAEGGAESFYYETLMAPYTCKNDKLESLEELRLVRGVTAEVFSRLKNYVTIYSSGLVNINTAPKMVLLSLSEDMTEYDADKIIQDRNEENEYEDINELNYLGDIFNEIKGAITVESGSYRITSVGTVNEISYKITNYVEKDKSTTRLLYSKEE